MFGDNDTFETMSKKMDDNFDKTATKMAKRAFVAAIIIYGFIALFIILLLYLIKVWFFGGF